MFASLLNNCKNKKTSLGLVVLAYCLVCPVNATDNLDVEVTANTIFKAFTKKHQIDAIPDISAESAISVQDYYIALLRPTWGMDVGYVAQFPDAATSSHLTGVLLENMFTGTRAIVDRSYGVQMHASGEILFRVASEKINSAKTRKEAFQALQSVIPAVRLSDNLIIGDALASESLTSAINLEVRFFVMGAELQLQSQDDWERRLASFSITLLDQDKNQIAVFDEALAIHPIDALLSMLKTLRERGLEIRVNDVLAIGSLTETVSVEKLSRLRAVFDGLSDTEQVSVYMGFR